MKLSLRITLALSLSVVMLFSMFPALSFAEEDTGGSDQEWAETKQEPINEGTGDNYPKDVTVVILSEETDPPEEELVPDNRGDDITGAASPEISLVWDKSASKFNYSEITYSDDNTEIDVSLNSYVTQTATLQLRFSMNGAESAKPGEIEIRIPMYIFTTRTDADTGSFKLNLQENVPQGNTGFYYKKDLDTNEIVIMNFNEIGSGESFICQIDYSFTPGEIKDGYSNTDITAGLTIRDGDKTDSEPLSITAHTSVAKPHSLSKTAIKYETWQTSWGAAPEDAANYYFLVWKVTLSSANSTQPYAVSLTDTQSDGVIIGSSTSVSGDFVDKSATAFQVTNLNSSSYSHTRYFLVEYPRDGISEGSQVTNHVTADLNGVDNTSGTPDQTIETIGSYTYSLLSFNYVGDSFSVYKYTGSSTSTIGMPDAMLNGSDEDMVSVKLTGGSSYPYSYYMNVDAKGYGLTLREGGDAREPGDYGQKNYTTELIDDMLFLKNERLVPGDYSIYSCYLSVTEYDYILNAAGTEYIEAASSDYSNYSPVELLYKTDAVGDWVSGGFIKRTGSSTYTYTGAGAPASINLSNQIVLPDGVNEISFRHVGSKYRVYMAAYITVELNSTAHVREILQSQSSTDLYNVCTLLVRDSAGVIRNTAGENTVGGTAEIRTFVIARDKQLYDSVVQHATNYLSLYKYFSNTSINKGVAANSFQDNGSVQRITYNLNMYEYGHYNPTLLSSGEYKALGIVREQKEGTFYDLLPKGTSVDEISVKTYYTNVVCDFSYHTVGNWQDSGRTMLIINVKAPEGVANYYEATNTSYGYNSLYSGFTLTYRLTNSYFNIIDNGIGTTNFVAYRSSAGPLGNGTTAPPSPTDYKYFQRLESDERDDGNNDTVYHYVSYNFTKPTAAIYGIFKQVKDAGGFSFDSEAETYVTGQYTYQLRYNNSSTAGKATNLIIYDVLEDQGDWRGALSSVDTSYAESKGIDPAVYYSTVTGLNPHGVDGQMDLNDTDIWSDERPESGVTAIAVDLSKKADGSLYEIGPNESVYCLVDMIAPGQITGLKDKLAVNRASYIVDYLLSGVTTKTKGLSKVTTVSLREPEITIEKSSDPESGIDINHPTVVARGETIEYTVSVKNNEGMAVHDIEIEDVIPDEVTIDFGGLKYYLGTDSDNTHPVAGSSHVSVVKSGQKLVFTVSSLPANARISFVIPTTVNRDTNDNDNIINVSRITKINGQGFVVVSNTTYHQVDPVLVFRATKILAGRDLIDGEFVFEARDIDTGAVVATARNDAGGVIVFSEIEYKEAGEHQYSVSEASGILSDVAYDMAEYEITVIVEHDDELHLFIVTADYPDGGIVFNNTYINPNPPVYPPEYPPTNPPVYPPTYPPGKPPINPPIYPEGQAPTPPVWPPSVYTKPPVYSYHPAGTQPKTGDSGMPALYIVLLCTSLAGIGIALKLGTRQRREYMK